MSGGGSSGGPSTQTVNQNSIPEWLQPYAMQMYGAANNLVFSPTGKYQQYQGQRVADFNPMQKQAFQNINTMQVSPQLAQAAGMTTNAANQSGAYANQNNDFYQNQPTNQVQTQDFSGPNVNKYMTPYMNDVVAQQKNAAVADYARSIPGMSAGAAAAGGLGGSRNALVQSEANRNLQNQLQGIQATGSQSAFQNAQQQFNAQQQAMQNAQMANQQAGLQNAGQAAQYGLAGRQLGLQGLAQQMQGGAQLGQLGMNDYAQRTGILSGQLNAGNMMQQQNQKLLDVPYQYFQEMQQQPYTQMQFLNSLYHGFAPNTQTTTYGGQPNQLGQIAGLAGGIAGASSLWS